MQTNVSDFLIDCCSYFIDRFFFFSELLEITPVQFPSINDSVSIHCHFNNDDNRLSGDISVEWFDGPFSIKAAANGITIKSSQTDTAIKSTIVFNRIQDLHFGQYTCKVTNSKEIIETATTSLLAKGIYIVIRGYMMHRRKSYHYIL